MIYLLLLSIIFLALSATSSARKSMGRTLNVILQVMLISMILFSFTWLVYGQGYESGKNVANRDARNGLMRNQQ